MKRTTIVLTGFPGFIAESLVRAAHAVHGENLDWIFLVQKSWMSKAIERARFLGLGHHQTDFVEADITQPQLGLSHEDQILVRNDADVFYHLAALYDLTADRSLCMQVNVEGTRQVLQFVKTCNDLKKFNYVSTCFVAGRRQGTIAENELEQRQTFFNFYEETKYLAEVEIQRAKLEVPTAIFRPAVVAGDSQTGEIPKFDGPYVLVRFLREWAPVLKRLPLMPNLGRKDCALNVISVDVVANTLLHGGLDAHCTGVFHVATPAQAVVSTNDMFSFVTEKVLGYAPWDAPSWLRSMIVSVIGFFPMTLFTGIPRESVQYLSYPGRFDTQNFEKLCQKYRIKIPNFKDTFSALIDFAQKNKRPCPHHHLIAWLRRFSMSAQALLLIAALLMMVLLITVLQIGLGDKEAWDLAIAMGLVPLVPVALAFVYRQLARRPQVLWLHRMVIGHWLALFGSMGLVAWFTKLEGCVIAVVLMCFMAAFHLLLYRRVKEARLP